MDFIMVQAPLGCATSIGLELLSFSLPNGNVFPDVHWFMGMLIVKAMHDESFSAHQALKDQRLPHELRLLFHYKRTHWRGRRDSNIKRSQGSC